MNVFATANLQSFPLIYDDITANGFPTIIFLFIVCCHIYQMSMVFKFPQIEAVGNILLLNLYLVLLISNFTQHHEVNYRYKFLNYLLRYSTENAS